MILRSPLRPPPTCLFCIQTSGLRRIILPFAHSNNNAHRTFSTTSHRQDGLPNHYETLGLPSSASHTEIKTQFYALSKRHHPDRNPNDAGASKRFVEISEAYHVLGSESKRQKYDRDYARGPGAASRGGVAGMAPRGSHFSGTVGRSEHAGSRPASGLSRRRGTFRGPPPSFYAQGSYGAHGAKRQAAASAGSHAHPSAAASASGAGGASGFDGGFSPGQQAPDYDPDPTIPYWDRAGHFRTHEGLRSRTEQAQAKRRSEAARWAEVDAYESGKGMLFNFLMVGGVVSLICMIPMAMLNWVDRGSERKRDKRGDG